MLSIRSSLLHFLIWLIVATLLFGLVALVCTSFGIPFFSEAISMLIMLPYMMSFYQMTQHLVKKYHVLPNKPQRWLLSIGCVVLFWLYTFGAGMLGIWLSGAEIRLKEIPPLNDLMLLFLGFVLLINIFLVVIGYFFLGKPAEIMLERQLRK